MLRGFAGKRTENMIARVIGDRVDRFHVVGQLGARHIRQLFEVLQPPMRKGQTHSHRSGSPRSKLFTAHPGNTAEIRLAGEIVDYAPHREESRRRLYKITRITSCGAQKINGFAAKARQESFTLPL